MAARMARIRIALTIARRTSIRAVGRSALIAAMVALPIGGLTAIGIVYDSGQASVQERITTELGQTQAALHVVSPPSATLGQAPDEPYAWGHINADGSYADSPEGDLLDPADVLPAGTRILALSPTQVTASTATGTALFPVTEGPSWDESFSGHYDVAQGRVPRTDHEVMATASLLTRLGIEIGGTVQLHSPASTEVTVVGVLDDHTLADSDEWFFARSGAFSDRDSQEALRATTYYLPDTELDWPAVQELNKHGITALSQSVLLNPPPAGSGFDSANSGIVFVAIFALVAILAGFAAFEVILLAGAAFTVTARQQQRTLATAASVGAPRRLLFRVLSANGIVLGTVGGLIGVGIGLAGAATFMILTANGSSTQYYGFHVPWLALAGFVAFAVLIGWIASLMPARNASRFDVVAALRGARKPPVPNRRRPAVGVVMLITGVGLTVIGGILMALLIEPGSRTVPYGNPLMWLAIAMLIVGPILAQLGLVLCGPLVLRVIAKLTTRMGIGARLASRDAARNPSRAVPALAAIMTTVFVAVFAMSLVASGQATTTSNYQYRQALGQVAVPLAYVDYENSTTIPYEHAPQVEDALKRTLKIDTIRTLASVPDPIQFGRDGDSANDAGRTDGAPDPVYAVPVVPPANLCPGVQASPEHTKAMDDPTSPENLALLDDWRCAANFLSMSSPTGAHLLVGDAADLALVLDHQPSEQARRTLASGGAVSLYPNYVHDGQFSIDWWSDAEQANMAGRGWAKGEPDRTESMDAVVELPEHPINFGVFISKATADRLGLHYRNSVVLASTTEFPDTAQRDAMNQAIQALPDNTAGNIYADLEAGPSEFATVSMWGLVGLAALIAIASAAVAIGLARFDGRQDDATLAALGARRLVRKNFAFWQALIIAGVGSLLGATMGLVPALALSANPDLPFTAPWTQIALTVVVLPLAIAAGSWLLATRSTVSARRMAIA